MTNISFINKELHHTKITGKKIQIIYKQGGKHQHELSLLVYSMQIIQIKQFTNDVPKNQGESPLVSRPTGKITQ